MITDRSPVLEVLIHHRVYELSIYPFGKRFWSRGADDFCRLKA
jgi:hypothetical protein